MADVPRCSDCPEHGCASGRCLAAYAPDQKAMQAALDEIAPERASLSVLTMEGDLPLPDPCQGGYCCECAKCVAEKVTPIKRVRQPWHPVRRAA